LIVRLSILYQRFTLINLTDLVSEEDIEEARRIISHRDPKDVPILALAIALKRKHRHVQFLSLNRDILEEAPKHGISVLRKPECCYSTNSLKES